MATVFISDLHLQPQKPSTAKAFVHFIQTQTQDLDALYILGDLFEAWIGDDFNNEFTEAIKSALKSVTDNGTPLYFLHGNRDFLIGQQFATETGCEILPDPTVVDLYGTPTLLMHGDTLCTEDVAYLEFRAMVRNPQWQQGLLTKSIPERLEMAQNLRDVSKEKTGEKSAEIMDVTQQEVERVMDKHCVNRLIHGHTHRPKVHQLINNDQAATRIVLGDWDKNGWMLKVTADSFELSSFEIEA